MTFYVDPWIFGYLCGAGSMAIALVGAFVLIGLRWQRAQAAQGARPPSTQELLQSARAELQQGPLPDSPSERA